LHARTQQAGKEPRRKRKKAALSAIKVGRPRKRLATYDPETGALVLPKRCVWWIGLDWWTRWIDWLVDLLVD
jgi:hypothetical protein